MIGRGLNPNNHHQGCLYKDQIPIIIIKHAWTWIKPHHQGRLYTDQIPITTNKDAWMSIKSQQASSRMLGDD